MLDLIILVPDHCPLVLLCMSYIDSVIATTEQQVTLSEHFQ